MKTGADRAGAILVRPARAIVHAISGAAAASPTSATMCDWVSPKATIC